MDKTHLNSFDALIMKGGGVKGLALAGAIEELEKCCSFKQYVGTSAGSIAAVLLAVGYTGSELRDLLWNKDFKDFLDGSLLLAPWSILVYKGIYKGRHFQEWLANKIDQKTGDPNTPLKDLKTRVTLYANRPSQRGGSTLVFDSSGDLSIAPAHFAVRCSMAIPYFFRPKELWDLRVTDGGLLNNYPVQEFIDEWRTETRRHGQLPPFVALYLGREDKRIFADNTFLSDLISIALERNDADKIRRYRDSTILIDTDPIGTFDFSLTPEAKKYLVASGRLAALEFLDARGILAHVQSEELSNLKKDVEVLKERVTQYRNRRKRTRNAAGIACAASIILALSIFGPVVPPVVDNVLAYVGKYVPVIGNYMQYRHTQLEDEASDIWHIYRSWVNLPVIERHKRVSDAATIEARGRRLITRLDRIQDSPSIRLTQSVSNRYYVARTHSIIATCNYVFREDPRSGEAAALEAREVLRVIKDGRAKLDFIKRNASVDERYEKALKWATDPPNSWDNFDWLEANAESMLFLLHQGRPFKEVYNEVSKIREKFMPDTVDSDSWPERDIAMSEIIALQKRNGTQGVD